MRKYIGMLKYELKTIAKDHMNLFMLLYPILMLIIAGIVLPLSLQGISETEAAGVYPMIFVLFSTIGAMMGGMLLGFSILENKDEKTFNSIAVTPLSLKGYIIFKSVYCTALSFFGNLVLIFGMKLFAGNDYITYQMGVGVVPIFEVVSNLQIITFAFAASLLTPVTGLLLGAFAKNKVEGLVYVKAGGIVVLLPALVVLPAFNGWAQYAMSIFPNFWCIKALFNTVSFNTGVGNLPFYAYLLIGIVLSLAVCVLSYKVFNKKIQIST